MNFRGIIMDYLAECLNGMAALRQEYPEETPSAPVVTYAEAVNSAYRTFDHEEYMTEYEAEIDVFAADIAACDRIGHAVFDAMRALGFRRTLCNDAAPIDGGRRKQMRFRGIIGPGNIVYQ